MPRILYDPERDRLLAWPRVDDEDVVGLEPPVVMLWIEQASPPTDYDPSLYGLEPRQDVDLDALVLRRRWELVELPPVVPLITPRWVQFAEELATNLAVNELVASCATMFPVLHLMLGVGMGQAAQGDATTFLKAWGMAVGAGLVTPELSAQMLETAQKFDLPAEFAEGLS